MKTALTLILFGITTAVSNAQPLQSGSESFETWNSAESGELPEYWDGFNRIVLFGGLPVGEVACITKDSLAPKDGNYSVKMTSTSIMGGPAVPGILTAGDLLIDFDTQSGDVTGGIPFTQKPDRLVGWYKYLPNGSDSAFVSVWFTENGVQVGEGSIKLATATSEWLEFSVDISYSAGAAPDTMNMIFMTTTQQFNVPTGSTLQLDLIAFESDNLGTFELSDNVHNWFVSPNPAHDCLSVSCDIETPAILRIYDCSGKICLQSDSYQPSTQLDVSPLEKGVYLLQITEGEHDYRSTILID